MKLKFVRWPALLALIIVVLAAGFPYSAFAEGDLMASEGLSDGESYPITVSCSGGDAAMSVSIDGIDQEGPDYCAKPGATVDVSIVLGDANNSAIKSFEVKTSDGATIARNYSEEETNQSGGETSYYEYEYKHVYSFVMPSSAVSASCTIGDGCRLDIQCSNYLESEMRVMGKESGDIFKEYRYLDDGGQSGMTDRWYILAAGEYNYELLNKADGSLYDSGVVEVSSGAVTTINWRSVKVTISKASSDGINYGTKECWCTASDGTKILPVYEDIKANKNYNGYFVLKSTAAGNMYTFDASPENESFVKGGKLATAPTLTLYPTVAASLSGSWKVSANEYKVTVPEGSALHAYRHPEVAYKEWGEVAPASTETADGKTTYTFKTVSGYLELVAGGVGTGFAKTYWSKQFRNVNEEVEMEVPAAGAEAASARDVFDGLYLNVADDGYYQALATGGEFRLEGYRVFQPTLSEIANRYLEPDMHYEVVYGDSVTVSDVQGGEGRHYATVTAVKQGVSIVKVTYDESYVASYYDGSLTRYSAIAPEQAGIVVFDVDGDGSSIESGIGLSKYDTVYFAKSVTAADGSKTELGDCGEYAFTPGEGVTVRTHKPYQLEQGFDESTWEAQAAGEDGSVAIPVYDGRNIVELSKGDAVRYFVVNAMGTDVVVSNTTSPGEALRAGDEASVSFTNLQLPVQKMTAIYNPGWYDPNYGMSEDSGTFLVGTLAGGAEDVALRGERTQYDIQSVSELEFTAGEPGDYVLEGVQINSTHMGSPLDSHCDISLAGLPQNLDADNNDRDPRYCVFPSVAVSIAPSAADQAAVDAFAAALGAVGTVTADSKDAVAAARAAYDSLTDAQKAFVPAESLKALVDAEQAYAKAAAEKAAAEKAAADKAAADKAAASNVNTATVTAAQVKKASSLGVTTITLGKKVKKIAKGAFKGTKITTIIVKTKKLKKKSVKGSLKGSKVKTVKVQVGSKKVNKKYVKKYKKIFTKKVAGKKAKVK